MTRNSLLFAVPACIAFQLAALPVSALAQGVFGSVDGVTRDSTSKQPVAHVRITAHNVSGGRDRSAISGPNGAFTIAKLEPGLYQVAAVRDGFAKSTASVQVTAPQTYRVDLLLAADSPIVSEAKFPPVQVQLPIVEIADEIAALKARISQLEAARTARAAAPVETADAATPTPGAPGAPQAAPTQTPAAPSIPEALQEPPATPGQDNVTPFAYGDFTWLNGNPRNKDTVLATKWFTPEVRFDTNFIEDFNQPVDHSMGGSTESFRNGEFQLEQISVGGDFRWQNVRGRFLYMDGEFATTTPRNDGSAGVGQWDLRDAYRYVSEAWGGYSFNVNHGLNRSEERRVGKEG